MGGSRMSVLLNPCRNACSLQLFLATLFFRAVQHECHTSSPIVVEFSMEELTRPTKSWQLQCISDLGAGTESNTPFMLSARVTLEHCWVSVEFEIETEGKLTEK